MRTHFVAIAAIWALQTAMLCCAALAGDISGGRVTMNGERPHATWFWLTGVGENPPEACVIGWTGGGTIRIEGLAGGRYWVAANEHGWYRHLFFAEPFSVPHSGQVTLNIHDHGTYDLPGIADLGDVKTASQTFVATGTDLAIGMVLSATRDAKVKVTIREGGPDGPQVGPVRSLIHGPLSPPIFRFAPGELKTIPGQLYTIRQDSEDGKPFRPCVSPRMNPYPNGAAWLDGVCRSEADLRVAVFCRDDGLVDEYRVDSGYRRKAYREVVQTFVPAGQELRLAQMMLAGSGNLHVMKVSVHEWTGRFPLGPQVGFAKHAQLMADFFEGVVWGPGELPLKPGKSYAIRYVRADGEPFSVYGDADGYAAGQAYFDGVPDSGHDLAGRMVIREADKGTIHVSDVSFEPISSSEIRVRFKTDVPTTATVTYKTDSPLFDTIIPAQAEAKKAHEIVVRDLAPGTVYPMSILAYHPARNVYRSAPVTVTTPKATAVLKGVLRDQDGPHAGATIELEGLGLAAQTDRSGQFLFESVPTGQRTMRIEARGCEPFTQLIETAAGRENSVQVGLTAGSELAIWNPENPMEGWIPFGEFDGKFDRGHWDVEPRTGLKWIGSVTSGTGGKKGGIWRTIKTAPGKQYLFGGWVLTHASGTSDDPVPGLAVARIGVDPTGGIDPKGPEVIWCRYRFTDARWRLITVPFKATGAKATLFAQHKYESYYVRAPRWAVGFCDLWLGLSPSSAGGA